MLVDAMISEKVWQPTTCALALSTTRRLKYVHFFSIKGRNYNILCRLALMPEWIAWVYHCYKDKGLPEMFPRECRFLKRRPTLVQKLYWCLMFVFCKYTYVSIGYLPSITTYIKHLIEGRHIPVDTQKAMSLVKNNFQGIHYSNPRIFEFIIHVCVCA